MNPWFNEVTRGWQQITLYEIRGLKPLLLALLSKDCATSVTFELLNSFVQG